MLAIEDLLFFLKQMMEKKEELKWLYGQTDGLLKTIYRLMSGEKKAAKKCRRARQVLSSSTSAGSEVDKAKTTIQAIFR